MANSNGEPVAVSDATQNAFAAIAHCCRCYWQPERWDEGNVSSVDWGELIAIAQTQGVLPLVYEVLRQQAWSSVSPAHQARLEAARHEQLRHNFRLLTGLRRLLSEFEQKQIPVLPFKGPILAEFLYGNVGLRQMRDLDLLLHPQDVPRTHELLWAQGYQEYDRLTPTQRQQRFQNNYENALFHPQTGLQIDLHWGIVPRYYACQLQPEELFQRAQTILFHGQPCLRLCPEDQLLLLCLNGLKDGWFELQRLCDVAAHRQQYPELNWLALLQRARAKDGDRAIILGLMLTHTVLGSPLPAHLAPLITTDRRLRFWHDRLHQRLYTQNYQDWNLWTQTLLPLQLQRRPASQLHSLRQLLFTVSERDVVAGALPPWLVWLYLPWRFIRLPWKYLKVLWQLWCQRSRSH